MVERGVVVTNVGFFNTILRFLNLFCRHMVDAKKGYLVRNQYFEGFGCKYIHDDNQKKIMVNRKGERIYI